MARIAAATRARNHTRQCIRRACVVATVHEVTQAGREPVDRIGFEQRRRQRDMSLAKHVGRTAREQVLGDHIVRGRVHAVLLHHESLLLQRLQASCCRGGRCGGGCVGQQYLRR